MLGLGHGENYLLIIHQRRLVVSWIYVYTTFKLSGQQIMLGLGYGENYVSAKPFNIF